MNRALVIAASLTVALGGCMPTTPHPAANPSGEPAAVPYTTAGLERVLDKDARQLTALFGPADEDVREGDARKLQFASNVCVLDTYLYPKNGGEQRVTYVDARQPDGKPIDRASCVAALVRRGGGR